MKQVLGILLEFGFHEIKKYIHSDFATKAAEKFDIVWFFIDKGSREFDDYFQSTGFPMVRIDESRLRKESSLLESQNNSVRRAWMINKKLGAFHNYRLINNRTFKNWLIGTDMLKQFYEKKTLREISNIYRSTYLAQLFEEFGICHLLTTGYSSALSKSALVTAKNINVKTWYLVNSWKDLYVNNFIPIDKLDGIFLWSFDMYKSYTLHMPYLKTTNFIVTGNPTFDALLNHKVLQPRSYYADKYGINKFAKWVLYSLMPPGINNNEIETVILLAGKVSEYYSKEEVVILVRRNPNHDRDDFIDLNLPKNVVLTNHYCTYDKEKDLIIQSIEGEQEWLDLLQYSDFNINVPSTVTLEFLTLGKPVLNVGFGPDGRQSQMVVQHFDAGFYRGLFSSNSLVHKVMDIDDLMDKFDLCLKISGDSYNTSFIEEGNLAADKIIQSIN